MCWREHLDFLFFFFFLCLLKSCKYFFCLRAFCFGNIKLECHRKLWKVYFIWPWIFLTGHGFQENSTMNVRDAPTDRPAVVTKGSVMAFSSQRSRLRRRLWSLASHNIVNIIMCPCLWYHLSGLILIHVVLINDGPEKILTGVSDWFYTLSESGYTESCMYVCFTCYFEDPAWTCMYVDEEINILL